MELTDVTINTTVTLAKQKQTRMWANVRWCQNGDFLRPIFPASLVQHISDLHSKFALGPHHLRKYGRHPICDLWD